MSSTVSVLFWLLEIRASALTSTAAAAVGAAAAATLASAGDANVGSGSGGSADGGGDPMDGGAAAVVALMDGVFGRCMSTVKGRQLLGKHFGAVVEQLVRNWVGGWMGL